MASSDVQQGSKYGKNFATSGGVSAAVQEVLAEEKFDMPVSCLKCSGAAECKKALMLLRVGKLNETIIEGMACEGGLRQRSGEDQRCARERGHAQAADAQRR